MEQMPVLRLTRSDFVRAMMEHVDAWTHNHRRHVIASTPIGDTLMLLRSEAGTGLGIVELWVSVHSGNVMGDVAFVTVDRRCVLCYSVTMFQSDGECRIENFKAGNVLNLNVTSDEFWKGVLW